MPYLRKVHQFKLCICKIQNTSSLQSTPAKVSTSLLQVVKITLVYRNNPRIRDGWRSILSPNPNADAIFDTSDGLRNSGASRSMVPYERLSAVSIALCKIYTVRHLGFYHLKLNISRYRDNRYRIVYYDCTAHMRGYRITLFNCCCGSASAVGVRRCTV